MTVSRCVILCAGPVADPAALALLLRPDDLIVAADGGLRLAKRLGVAPAVVVADLDSAAPAEAAGEPLIRLPVRKDCTDAAAAAEYAVSCGCREILLLGATGGRLDHEYGALLLLVQLARQGVHAVIADEKNRIEAHTASPVRPAVMPGWTLSLFAFGAPVEDLCIEGADYPLMHYRLLPDDPLCVSNTALSGCTVTFSDGLLLVYRSHD